MRAWRLGGAIRFRACTGKRSGEPFQNSFAEKLPSNASDLALHADGHRLAIALAKSAVRLCDLAPKLNRACREALPELRNSDRAFAGRTCKNTPEWFRAKPGGVFVSEHCHLFRKVSLFLFGSLVAVMAVHAADPPPGRNTISSTGKRANRSTASSSKTSRPTSFSWPSYAKPARRRS